MNEYGLNRDELKKFAYSVFCKLNGKAKPVFLCVGSDKFVCDSLAPIVGEILIKKYNINAYVYGSLDYNINANNLTLAMNYIETQHPGSQIILIDATLGDNVGKVVVSNGSFAGLGKILPIKKIGDFSILGVVGRKSKNFDLNSTRLNLVVSLSKFIAKGIALATYVDKFDS